MVSLTESIRSYIQTGQFSEELFQGIQRITIGVARRFPAQIMPIYGGPSDAADAFREHVRDFIQDVFQVLLRDSGKGNVLEQYAQEACDDAHIEHGIQAIALSAIKRHPKVRCTLDERIYRALREILLSEPFTAEWTRYVADAIPACDSTGNLNSSEGFCLPYHPPVDGGIRHPPCPRGGIGWGAGYFLRTVSGDGRGEGGRLVGSGVYVVRMQAGQFVAARKMVMVQ